jgi:ABC-type polysaccharide/polyol phosphate transport system ATPase subunit
VTGRGPAVEVRDISVVYRLARNRTTSIQEFAIRMAKRQIEYEDLWALRDVSFRLEAGEILGVIGANGAGKSTLMKVVARVLPPARGRIVVRGRVAPMIELGAGFHPDLTGLENLVLYGTILGNDPRTMRRHAMEIADWAELRDFLDVPIRSYSSGMVARLGFAVATWGHPDVVLVDEVFAVGDERFRGRSLERFEELLGEGAAVLLVSHALDSISRVAHRAIWLDRGRVRATGDPTEIVRAYASAVTSGPSTLALDGRT